MTIADLHIHTNYSHDSRTTMEQYAVKAIERGIDIICFTDHLDCNEFYNTIKIISFARRAEEFDRVKARYGGSVKLLLGVEFAEPHLHKDQHKMVLGLGLDMIIGSIHYPLDLQLLADGDNRRRYYERMYDDYLVEMVSNGGFDVLGHLDMPKRYNEDYVADVAKQQSILQLCVDSNIVPEINTSSIRKRNLAPMPSLGLISYYCQIGGRYVTVNSDSHTDSDLGADIESTARALPAGIRRCYFENRQLVPID